MRRRITYDPEAARAILDEAGWDSNTELQWMMWTPPAAAQDALQAMLADAGIRTTYKQIDVATVVDQLYREGNYDLVFANFGPYQSILDNWKYIKCGWSTTRAASTIRGIATKKSMPFGSRRSMSQTSTLPIWHEMTVASGSRRRTRRSTASRLITSGIHASAAHFPISTAFRFAAFERVWIAPE